MTGNIDFFEEEMAPSEDNMTRLNSMVQKAGDLKAKADDLSVELAEVEEELKGLLRQSIPDLLMEMGLSKVATEDGKSVAVEGKVKASIKNENKPAAFAWLRENDFDGIIKSKLQLEFGKGEQAEAAEAVAALDEIGITAGLEDSVHPATLTSFVKERLEAGEAVPESFTYFEYKEAKISVPKAKKSRKIK